jgi:hypothetical protein
MDLFNPTDNPQDLAVTRAIDQAVEMFISGQIAEADHCFEMAEGFVRAPAELFAQPINA